MTIEAGQVFTLESELMLPGYSCVRLEEDALVTEDGVKYLGEPQRETS